MALTYGTSYFVNEEMARRYYWLQGLVSPEDAAELVKRKLAEGEIHIGLPPLENGDTVALIDNGTRYAIVSGPSFGKSR